MKKSIVLFFCGLIFSFDANASFPDLTPLSSMAPQVCAPCTSEKVQMFKSAYEVVQSASSREGRKQMFNDVEAQAKSYVKAQVGDYLEKGLSQLKKNVDERPISYTRVIKKTKTDVGNADEVKTAFKKYFLYVPSDNEEVRASYKGKRDQFVEDATLELYITSKEMDKELKVMISQLDLIKKCVIEGDNEECKNQGMEEYNCQKGEETEDEMCYRRNMLMAAQIYDTIMKYNEYLIAMRSQYEAVRALGSSAKPKEPEGQSTQQSSSLSRYFESTSSYAFEEIDDAALVVENLPDSKFDFADNNKSGAKTPLADKQDDIKAMAVFSEVQTHLSNAFESHNLKQQLPEFKRVFDTYHDMEKMHAKAVENLQASQQCVLNYLDKRYPGNSEKVWLDNCMLDSMEGYVCKYSPAKSVSDISESEGLYDVFCPDDSSQKCYKLAPTAYNEIGGMSGWLINMYLDAKDELSDTLTPDNDNYVVAAASTEIPQDHEVGPGTGAYSAEKLKKQFDDKGLLIDTFKENMRVLSRLPYSIGVTANNEINKDTNGVNASSKFGVATTPFPLWNDQINFYNQYIDGKYENLKDYLQNEPLFKDILNLGLKINETYEYQQEQDQSGIIKSVELIRKEVADTINGLLGALENDTEDKTAEINKLLAEEDAKLSEILKDYHEQLDVLNNQRMALYKQLEDINIKTADLHEEITKQDSVINYAENYNELAEQGAEMDKDYQNPKNPHKTNQAVFEENIDEQTTKENAAENSREIAVGKLDSVNGSREDVLNAINAKEREIMALKQDYVLAYYNMEQKYKTDIDKVIKSYELSAAQQSIKDAITSLPVLKEAEVVIKFIRDYATAKVDEALEKIHKMNRDLYYAENNPKVVKIHSEMIDKIKNPNIEDIMADLQLDEAGKAMLRKYAAMLAEVFSDICDSTKCYDADNDYFVGLIAQKRDFAAPKAPVEFSSAPLREVFSFGLNDINYVDYYTAKDFKIGADLKIIGDGKADITTENARVLLLKRSLSDSGVELPEIWKIVLSKRPFVQKEIDFKSFLGASVDENSEMANSGIYPCKLGDKYIAIGGYPNRLSYVTMQNGFVAGYKNIPQCQTVAETDGKYYDREAKAGLNEINISTNDGLPMVIKPTSELGHILRYEEIKVDLLGANGLPMTDEFGMLALKKDMSYLTFNEAFLQALQKIASVKDENDLNAEYYLYNRILPQNSQFGDYLMKVDEERMALEVKEKIKNKIYSTNVNDLVIVNSLYKSFSEMGYDFDRQDFDLSRDDYYKQAENILNARKEDNIRQAKAILDANQGLNLTSEKMIKRKEDLLNQISLLELDTEELVLINGTESLETVAENIKVQKTDAAVRELATKVDEGQKELREKIENSSPVYCSVYAE